MKNIGLLFGSFNPLHNGHIMLAEAALQEADLDEIWFVVQRRNDYKPAFDFIDYNTRLQLIVDSGYKVYEPHSTDYAHLVRDTLKELTDHHLTLLLGEDLAASFASWDDYDEIARLATIYQSHRIDDISSGLIRDRLAHNQPIDDLVPPAVANYLAQHQQ